MAEDISWMGLAEPDEVMSVTAGEEPVDPRDELSPTLGKDSGGSLLTILLVSAKLIPESFRAIRFSRAQGAMRRNRATISRRRP
jgi:hypothetical protein